MLTIASIYGFNLAPLVPTMLIVCPSCVSAYRLPAEAIHLAPKAVRCAQCAAVFEPLATPVAARALKPVLLPPTPLAAPRVISEPAFRPARASQDPEPPRRRSRTGAVAAFAAMILALNMAGIALRERVVGWMPVTAPIFASIGLPARKPGLILGGVETALADDGQGRVLTLEGKINNPGGTEAPIPDLRIVVRDADEQSVYSWTTPAPQSRLGPGEEVDFRSRLVSPPHSGHDIVVSFAGQTDSQLSAQAKTGP